MSDVRTAVLARRVAASRKAAETRKRMRAFVATGAPVQDMPERGAERGDYGPGEILDRIRAAGQN